MDVNPPDPGRPVLDDPESPDAAPLDGGAASFDLTPRTGPGTGGRGSRGTRTYVAIGALVALLGALGFVLFQGLNDAATFFHNVDEAVARRDDLGTDRFRMQGNVVDGTVQETAEGVSFVISFDGAEVPVQHTGTPPELFGPDIPVVIEGNFTEDGFASDEILIRHDNTYDEEHPDRIADAERDAQAAPADAGEGDERP